MEVISNLFWLFFYKAKLKPKAKYVKIISFRDVNFDLFVVTMEKNAVY